MKHRALLSLFLIAPILAVAACDGAPVSGFNREVWIDQRGAHPQENRRGAMLPDLESRLRPGMNKTEVEALLGPPDERAAAAWTYELGVSPYGIDMEYLRVDFGADGLLSGHTLVRG